MDGRALLLESLIGRSFWKIRIRLVMCLDFFGFVWYCIALNCRFWNAACELSIEELGSPPLLPDFRHS